MCSIAYLKSPFFLAGAAAFTTAATFMEVVKTTVPEKVVMDKIIPIVSPILNRFNGTVIEPAAQAGFSFIKNSVSNLTIEGANLALAMNGVQILLGGSAVYSLFRTIFP
jgi:hypothetical protein